MRKLAFILVFLAAAVVVFAAETNYFCVVCGKGPLTGHFWLHPRGAICDDCYKLENHCSICGLPIRDGYVKTEDGRFICKFDKADAVLDADTAKEIFADTRRDLADLFGRSFLLQYPDVTVKVFDVDYWSEKGTDGGLHKFGFSSTRKTPSGVCTHEVVLLSGRLREETIATSAHEYTHLWINENCPTNHVIDSDTVEAICELISYKLMGEKKLAEMQKQILENPYTHGKIKALVASEKEHDIGYVMNWVRNGTTATIDEAGSLPPAVVAPVTPLHISAADAAAGTADSSPPAEMIRFNGWMTMGSSRQAVINGVAFSAGEQHRVKLPGRTVSVRCRDIQGLKVVLEIEGVPGQTTLKIGEGIPLP